MNPINLSILADTLEIHSDNSIVRIDLEEGNFVMLDSMFFGAVEENDEEALADLPEWQKEEIPIARAILEDENSKRFIAPPDSFDFHEYRHMERFINTFEDAQAADELYRAIQGRGAFRYFKDMAHRLGIIERWYAYRDNALREFLIDWAEEHNVPYEDDLR